MDSFKNPSPVPGTLSLDDISLDNHIKKVGQKCVNPREVLYICACGHVMYRVVPCNSRRIDVCEYCARKWYKKMRKKIKEGILKMDRPKLVTLTLKKDVRLRERYKDLFGMFQMCRRYLKRRGYKIRRFVAVKEEPNHIHAVMDCDYIPQHELSEIWRMVTGDSFIVDIRKVEKHRHKGAVNYLCKYLLKAVGNVKKYERIVQSWNIKEGGRWGVAMCGYCMADGVESRVMILVDSCLTVQEILEWNVIYVSPV